MREWLRGQRGGLAAYLLIAGLVAGGLGWATAAALGLERDQLARRAEAERAGRLRLALWRLDGRVAPFLAREDSRPFNHYSAIYAPPLAFNRAGSRWPAGTVLEPSPLLGGELPDWMALHFQVDPASGWESPQVPPPALVQRLRASRLQVPLGNVTPARQQVLASLARDLPAANLLDLARGHTRAATLRDTTLLVKRKGPDQAAAPNADAAQVQAQQANSEYGARSEQLARLMNEGKGPQLYDRDFAINSALSNGANWLTPNSRVSPGAEVLVTLSPMVPLWVTTGDGRDRLLVLRLVHIEDREVCQGMVLDGPRLQTLLMAEVADLFPGARIVPVREAVPEQPEDTMTALPFRLDPGPPEVIADAGWTPLRVGLALSWAAALVALLAVGLGGWSLLDLSERRIRFVSAVTHELRTPLTTLRLYLDMLRNGLVRDEPRREEYIRTLHAEADRLSRLVGNVLDFSRLERQRPKLARARVPVTEMLSQVQAAWQGRCQDAGKELIVDNAVSPGEALWTDADLLQQVLGNLIDNACKYSRGAGDRRIWVRVRREGPCLLLEVEDRGPGVSPSERRSIFRAFRRGQGAEENAGGVGLGLALALRWTGLLGGRLTLQTAPAEGGACFRVELPGQEAGPAGGPGEAL